MEPRPTARARASARRAAALAAPSALLALLLVASLPLPSAQAEYVPHTALCPLPTVGVTMDGSGTCYSAPPVPAVGVCTYGVYVGATRVCVLPPPPPAVGVCSYGVYVGTTRVCQPVTVPSYGLCTSGYGVHVGTTYVCETIPNYGFCGAGYTGAYVGATGVCQPTPSVGTCSPPSSVGATVNGIGTCQAPPSVTVCSYGVLVNGAGVCQPAPTVGLCNYGVVVNGIAACTGIPSVPSVEACNPPSSAGAKVNGIGACQNLPSATPCGYPSVGVQPTCVQQPSVSTCNPPASAGATVNGQGACVPLCPAGVTGTPSPGQAAVVCGQPAPAPYGGVLNPPRVRASGSDSFIAHLGLPGAAAVAVAPNGAAMRVAYEPACPGSMPRPAADVVRDCSQPIVASVDFTGRVQWVRDAYDPSRSLPASLVRVTCEGSAAAPTACLQGAAADGTWTLVPAPNYQGLPAGTRLSVQGKVFSDVAAASDPIETTGSGQDSRSAGMELRLWNWNAQAAAAYSACDAPSPTFCWSGAPEENALFALFYPGA